MKKQILTLYYNKTGDVVKVYKGNKTLSLEKDGIQIEISKNILNYLSKSLKESKMKKLIDKFIIQFSHKNPQLWLEINEAIFDEIEDCRKKQKDKIYKNIQELINKFK
jgi:hypothetical protein